jgi:SpoVK/Ycf46/Vps4 family AAA+-type ATPase
MPGDIALRLHLAELMLGAGRQSEAITHIATALQQDPASASAQALMGRALGALPTQPNPPTGFDWSQAESEVADLVEPAFVRHDEDEPSAPAFDVERSGIRLADVGGLADVKDRLEMSFLGPSRSPELRRLYGKSLRGGLLMYGPPGCGKSFLARALAGELEAGFVSLQLHDVLDMYIGASEKNLHQIFELARRSAPCVLFIDELDAIGQRRSQLRNNAMRTTVNQLLTELDGIDGSNEGVYVVGATNHPWDVDSALRRPGRFDRTILVPPPDAEAREHIFRTHLSQRPVQGVDLRKAAKITNGFSGADIAHVCETAAERALRDSMRSGNIRMIDMRDLEAAVKESRSSTGPWFDTAKNVVMFANEGGTYDDLREYMRANKLL